MRLIIILMLTVLHIGCLKNPSNTQLLVQNDLEGFKQFLGSEKAKADGLLVAAFDQFLMDNYPNEKNQHLRTKRFLEFLSSPDLSNIKDWNLKSTLDKTLLTKMKESGLRQEIWLIPYSEYNSYQPKHNIEDLYVFDKQEEPKDFGELILPEDIDIEPPNTSNSIDDEVDYFLDEIEQEKIDNYLRANYKGDYFYGLAQYSTNDANIQEYIKAIVKAGDMSPAPVFLQKFINFEEPFVKRVIILEYFRIGDI